MQFFFLLCSYLPPLSLTPLPQPGVEDRSGRNCVWRLMRVPRRALSHGTDNPVGLMQASRLLRHLDGACCDVSIPEAAALHRRGGVIVSK